MTWSLVRNAATVISQSQIDRRHSCRHLKACTWSPVAKDNRGTQYRLPKIHWTTSDIPAVTYSSPCTLMTHHSSHLANTDTSDISRWRFTVTHQTGCSISPNILVLSAVTTQSVYKIMRKGSVAVSVDNNMVTVSSGYFLVGCLSYF